MPYKSRKKAAYGINNPLQKLNPLPILAQRDPTNADFQEIGTTWINELTNDLWVITSVAAGVANWEPIGNDTGGAAPISKYIVDADGTGDYTTIQAAINAAVAAGIDATVYVRPGTYTENLVLADGIDIYGSIFSTIIVGVHTPPAAGNFEFFNVTLQSATHIFNSAVAGTARLAIAYSVVQCTNGYTFNLLNWTGVLDFTQSVCDGAGADGFVNNTGGSYVFVHSSRAGNNTTVPMIASNGIVEILSGELECPVTFGGTATATISMGSAMLATVTTAATATLYTSETFFSTGITAAISHGSAGVLILSNCTITSSANPCITGAGAGAVTFSDVNFTSNALLAATLTRAFVAETKSSKVTCGDDVYRVDDFSAQGSVIQAYCDDDTAAGASSNNSILGDLSVSAGDGNSTPYAIEGRATNIAGSNTLATTAVYGYTNQADDSAIASTGVGVEGHLDLLETDAADLPQVFGFGVKGYLDAVDTTAAPTTGIFAGVGSVVEYNTPFDGVAYGMAVSRLDAGAGAGTAGLAAYGVVQGTVAAADWLYGLDLYNGASGVAYTNSDVRFQNESTITLEAEGVEFSGDISSRSLSASNTKIKAFNSNPIGQLSGGAGALCTGATGTVNNIHLQDGVMMQSFMIGAGQTKILPVLEADGLEIALDTTNTEGAEYNFGYLSSSKHVYTIGTSAAFFVEATFKVADVSGCEPLVLGFRKIEANNATWTLYTDYSSIGIVTSQNADLISLSTEVDGGGTTYTNTTDAFTDGQTHTLRVNVDATGNATYLIDGVAPTATAAFQFDNGDEVMPFIHLVHAAVAPGKIHLVDFECGLQAWN